MHYLHRILEKNIAEVLTTGKSILLLGPRQTGKTTLINQIAANMRITLANPKDRIRYEKAPFLLTAEVEAEADKNKNSMPFIIIDEMQKLPILMDAIQDLIDRKVARFLLTGSSARKLRRGEQINLLPGRIIPLRLDPLTQLEFKYDNIEKALLYGSLPEIALLDQENQQEQLLDAYVTIYLEEEVRSEAVVRDLGHFARFLELAASQSGKIVNFTRLSQEIGVSQSTIAGYYQILEDCLVAERIEPIIMSKTRKKLSRTQKYLLYDLGVRRIAAREGKQLPREQMDFLFEQYIGLELIRLLRLFDSRTVIKYWRDPTGPEVDWVIDMKKTLIPIEVKWTEAPKIHDAKYLKIFLEEYQESQMGFIVCRTPRVMKLASNIYAIPWSSLNTIFEMNNRLP